MMADSMVYTLFSTIRCSSMTLISSRRDSQLVSTDEESSYNFISYKLKPHSRSQRPLSTLPAPPRDAF